MAPRQPYWSAHVDQHNVAWYDVSALLYLSDAGVDRPSLQRYLVATHDLRFKVHRMPKVRGRAWKKAWIPATKRSRKPFVSHGTIFAQGAAFFEGLADFPVDFADVQSGLVAFRFTPLNSVIVAERAPAGALPQRCSDV